MLYLFLSVVLWIVLFGLNGRLVAQEGPSRHSEPMHERLGFTDADKQEVVADRVQQLDDGRLTKKQLRAVIRARRERVRAEMKVRRESLRAEGAEIQQEIMAKKARVHLYHREAAEVLVQPAN